MSPPWDGASGGTGSLASLELQDMKPGPMIEGVGHGATKRGGRAQIDKEAPSRIYISDISS